MPDSDVGKQTHTFNVLRILLHELTAKLLRLDQLSFVQHVETR